jgi:hypothetical protein
MTGQSAGMQNSGGFGVAVAIGSDYSLSSIDGQTNRSDFFLMDGLYNYGAIESTYAVAPIMDAIQEFKVVSYTAEYNYFLPLTEAKPAYHQDLFEGSGGGPVCHDSKAKQRQEQDRLLRRLFGEQR